MNKLNVYHCDIKDTNVVVKKETNLKTRLIDWGLSFVHNKNKIGIPNKLYRRPFQFNVPFSSILFNKNNNISFSLMDKIVVDAVAVLSFLFFILLLECL